MSSDFLSTDDVPFDRDLGAGVNLLIRFILGFNERQVETGSPVHNNAFLFSKNGPGQPSCISGNTEALVKGGSRARAQSARELFQIAAG